MSFIPELHNVYANQIHDSLGNNTSKGERKLRANLFEMLGLSKKGIDERTADIANHFLIAVSGGVETYEDRQKTALLPGRVAVKVDRATVVSGGKVREEYTYVFLNLNSLSKRLGIDKKTIKKAEANGNLDELIKTRIEKIVSEQKQIETILGQIHSGFNILEKKVGEPYENVNTNKDLIEKFVKEHFSNDGRLMSGLDDFLRNPIQGNKEYLKNLVSKLWWDTGTLTQALGVRPEKVAINSSTPQIVYGTAAARPGNKGTREVYRLSLIHWDIDKRYSIALEDDFIYSSKPQRRSNNEVPLKISGDEQPERWVLVNKNSLKRLGIPRKVLNDENVVDSIGHLVSSQANDIEHASKTIADLKNTFSRPGGYRIGRGGDYSMETLETLIQNHPDEKFKAILGDYVKKYGGNNWDDEKFKEATQAFLDVVTQLEEARLIETTEFPKL